MRPLHAVELALQELHALPSPSAQLSKLSEQFEQFEGLRAAILARSFELLQTGKYAIAIRTKAVDSTSPLGSVMCTLVRARTCKLLSRQPGLTVASARLQVEDHASSSDIALGGLREEKARYAGIQLWVLASTSDDTKFAVSSMKVPMPKHAVQFGERILSSLPSSERGRCEARHSATLAALAARVDALSSAEVSERAMSAWTGRWHLTLGEVDIISEGGELHYCISPRINSGSSVPDPRFAAQRRQLLEALGLNVVDFDSDDCDDVADWPLIASRSGIRQDVCGFAAASSGLKRIPDDVGSWRFEFLHPTSLEWTPAPFKVTTRWRSETIFAVFREIAAAMKEPVSIRRQEQVDEDDEPAWCLARVMKLLPQKNKCRSISLPGPSSPSSGEHTRRSPSGQATWQRCSRPRRHETTKVSRPSTGSTARRRGTRSVSWRGAQTRMPGETSPTPRSASAYGINFCSCADSTRSKGSLGRDGIRAKNLTRAESD